MKRLAEIVVVGLFGLAVGGFWVMMLDWTVLR